MKKTVVLRSHDKKVLVSSPWKSKVQRVKSRQLTGSDLITPIGHFVFDSNADNITHHKTQSDAILAIKMESSRIVAVSQQDEDTLINSINCVSLDDVTSQEQKNDNTIVINEEELDLYSDLAPMEIVTDDYKSMVNTINSELAEMNYKNSTPDMSENNNKTSSNAVSNNPVLESPVIAPGELDFTATVDPDMIMPGSSKSINGLNDHIVMSTINNITDACSFNGVNPNTDHCKKCSRCLTLMEENISDKQEILRLSNEAITQRGLRKDLEDELKVQKELTKKFRYAADAFEGRALKAEKDAEKFKKDMVEMKKKHDDEVRILADNVVPKKRQRTSSPRPSSSSSSTDIQVELSHESRVLSRSLPASRGEQAYLKGGNSSFFTETAKNHQVSIYVEEERSVNISGDYRNVNTCYDYLRGRLQSYTSRPLPKKGKVIEKKSTDKLKNINCRFQFKPDGCKVPTCPFKHVASKKKSPKKKKNDDMRSSKVQKSNSSSNSEILKKLEQQEKLINDHILKQKICDKPSTSSGRRFDVMAHHELQQRAKFQLNNNQPITQQTICWNPNCSCKD